MIGFLNQNQIYALLDILRYQQVVFMGNIVGKDFLSKDDIEILTRHGIDINKAIKEVPYSEVMFNMGRLASALRKGEAEKMTYREVKDLMIRGAFRPLNVLEKATLEEVKNQTYSAIKGLENTILTDVHNTIIKDSSQVRKVYEDIIRDESKKVVEGRKSLTRMMLDIGKATGDWSRKLSRVVETEMHNVFDRGRASIIMQREGTEALVYKDVKFGACKHCVKLYLTAGYGSMPIIFRLGDLLDNGNNIGVKVADYKPVIGSTHPYCRCTLNYVPVGYTWDENTKDFSQPDYSQTWRKTNAHKIAPILIATDTGVKKI